MDSTDQLIWDEAPKHARQVAIIDAPALVASALTLTDDVRVWCDDWRDAQLVQPNRRANPDDLSGADLVLARLPKSLAALDEQASKVQGDKAVTYVGGGRIKHMNRSMNSALEKHFEQVAASLGKGKSRVLRATGSRGVPTRWPKVRHDPTLDLTVTAYGSTFGGSSQMRV